MPVETRAMINFAGLYEELARIDPAKVATYLDIASQIRNQMP
jgi:hypothetical protein